MSAERSRDADDKDKINIPQSVVADRNGDFYVGGNARIGTQDVGLVSVYDFNGKQKRVIGKEKREDSKSINCLTDIALTDEELQYLKQRVDFIDRNGMFSEFTMPTYVKILDEPLKEEQQAE